MPTPTWEVEVDPNYVGTGASVAYSPSLGLWVIASDYNFITSPDGFTWTQRSTPFDNSAFVRDVVWCDTLGIFVASGYADAFVTPIIITSSDGISWTGQSTPWDSTPGEVDGLGWSPDLGQIVATGNEFSGSTTVIMTSPDGTSWTSHSTPADGTGTFRRAAWSSDLSLWVAIGATLSNPVIMSSTNGTTWTTRLSSSPSGNDITDICWSHDLGLFCCVGNIEISGVVGGLATSPDGITWTLQTIPSPFTSGTCTGVCWSSFYGIFVVGGNTTAVGVLTSPDGITWTVDNSSTYLGVFTPFNAEARGFAAGNKIVFTGSDHAGTTSRILLGYIPSTGLHIDAYF